MKLRTATLAEPYYWVWPMDDALDRPTRSDGESVEDYSQRLDTFAAVVSDALDAEDMSRLPTSAGESPALFKLKHLRGRSAKLVRDLLAVCYVGDEVDYIKIQHARLAACKMALIGVENLQFDDGTEFEIVLEYDKEFRVRCVSEESIGPLCEIPGLVPAIGDQVFKAMSPKKG